MSLNDAMNELALINTRLHAIKEIWREIGRGVDAMVSDWQSADKKLRHEFLEYRSYLNPSITEEEGVKKVSVQHGSVTLRVNDPLGHVSVRFERRTSFGVSNLLVLYSLDIDEHGGRQLVSIDEADATPCSLENLIETIRQNLVHPRIQPARVSLAMTELNAHTTPE
jgi:hypothetical protein